LQATVYQEKGLISRRELMWTIDCVWIEISDCMYCMILGGCFVKAPGLSEEEERVHG